MKNSDLPRVLEDISQDHVPLDENLLPRIMANIERGKKTPMKHKIKFVPAILLVAAAFVLTILTVPGAATAMRKVFGFIPGIGLVEQNASLRVLAEPVTQNRDGFTLTVENGVIGSEQTVISYSVEGPFASGAFQAENSLSDICFTAAELRLPDGTVLQVPGGFPKETWKSGYRAQNFYAAIPYGVDEATLVLPCVNAMPIGQGPQNWEIPLVFITAPKDMVVYPIGQNQQTGDSTLGINMYLDSVIPLADSQLVQVRVDWQENPNIIAVNLHPEDVRILNPDGVEVAFKPSSEAVNPDENDPTSVTFGFKTALMDTEGPAQLIVNAASEVVMKSAASFTFDPSAASSADQVWTLNEELDLDGYTLRIVDVTLAEAGGNASLTINMESSDDIIGAGVSDAAHTITSGADGRDQDISDGGNLLHKFWVTLNYDGGIPEGPITFTVPGYTIRMDEQPWIIEWNPTAAPANDPATAEQSQVEYLSQRDWQKAQTSNQSIPDGFNQQVLLELTIDEGNLHNQLAVSNLDGSEMKFLVEDASNGAVSPDGNRITYTDASGAIHVYDLATGTDEPLAGADMFTGIERLFWSPDGAQIGFTGTDNNRPMNIYISELDGTSPRMIEAGEPLKLMQGWLPDGRILYVTQDQNGPVLKLIEPQSGAMSSLFNVPQLATSVEASKDGRRLAIHWLEESTGEQYLYVYTADGSQRSALLKMNDTGNLRGMAWSTDGNWLIADLSWDIPGEPYIQAMIQVDTYQIIALSDLEGMVLDWMP